VTFQKIQKHLDVYQFQRKIVINFERYLVFFKSTNIFQHNAEDLRHELPLKLKILFLLVCVRVCVFSLCPK